MENLFPVRLKKARKASNFSQVKLEELADLSPTLVCTYEKGSRSPTLKTFAKFTTILGVNADWLLGQSSI